MQRLVHATIAGADHAPCCCSCGRELEETECPKGIRANIKSGMLHAWGFELGLPISGSGVFKVLYLDEVLRIFSSEAGPLGTTVVVQVKQSAIPRAEDE
eukprot:365192-Chlamydomonas_euryale.AAC.4